MWWFGAGSADLDTDIRFGCLRAVVNCFGHTGGRTDTWRLYVGVRAGSEVLATVCASWGCCELFGASRRHDAYLEAVC